MHALHARLPKNFVLEERLERYGRVIELEPEKLRGRWAQACWPGIGAEGGDTGGRGAENSGGDAAGGAAGEELGVPRYREVRLDLGCGKGAFSIESARREPDVLFVAMDSEPVCVAYAAQHVCESGLPNVVVVPATGMRVREFFSPGELSCIYLNFPTPFPRKRDAHRRMASMERLMDFREVLAPRGEVRLRTDSQPLFDFMLTQIPLAGYELLWQTRDAHAEAAAGGGAGAAGATSANAPAAAADVPESEYEQRLSAQGANVLALIATPGPAPEHPVQTAELSLSAYLPHDLESLSSLGYAPHGMEATVVNLRNRAARERARSASTIGE